MAQSQASQSICDLKDSKLNRSTDRFDEKLVSKLKFPVPGLRPTMIDHSVMRLPMSRDPVKKKIVTEKPDRYMAWKGDAGGDFCRPVRASITSGPTSYDSHVENVASINGIENIFSNYFNSGERSQFPEWTRTHWTMNTTGEGSMLTKQDLRKSAFREISAKTVAPGPYWNGFESALNRPQTGAVLSAEAITKSSIYYKPDQPSDSVVNKGKVDSRTEEKGLFQASSRIGSASSTSRSAQFNMPTARSNNNSDNINNNNNNNNSARSNSFKNYLATTRSSSARICSSRRETYRESARENMFKSSSSSARSRFQTTGDMMIAGLNTEPVPVVASGRTSRRVGATEANLWN